MDIFLNENNAIEASVIIKFFKGFSLIPQRHLCQASSESTPKHGGPYIFLQSENQLPELNTNGILHGIRNNGICSSRKIIFNIGS